MHRGDRHTRDEAAVAVRQAVTDGTAALPILSMPTWRPQIRFSPATSARTAVRESAEELGIAVSSSDLVRLTALHRRRDDGSQPSNHRVDFPLECRTGPEIRG
ncbi:hypothetical protein Pd630_LPD17007 (plasmid) [Rhodococcus opacus PD630]|nr:hypothetical protein Pd630_LPD17007 [Rhodococcus opacus PD630]